MLIVFTLRPYFLLLFVEPLSPLTPVEHFFSSPFGSIYDHHHLHKTDHDINDNNENMKTIVMLTMMQMITTMTVMLTMMAAMVVSPPPAAPPWWRASPSRLSADPGSSERMMMSIS